MPSLTPALETADFVLNILSLNAVGFITLQDELRLFLPLEDQDVIIFDSMLYVL